MSDSVASRPPPPGITPNFKQPEDAFRTASFIVNILCVAIVTPILLLRLYTRAFIQHAMNREDWTCLVAWLIFVPYIVSNIMMGYFNGGYHQWEVTELGFQQFTHAEYVSAVIYGPCVLSIKITLLLIFTRIFAPSPRTVILTYIIMAIITSFYVPMFFTKIFMCSPIAGFWNRNLHPKCIDISKLFLSDTLMSVVSDTAVLALPLPAVWGLRLPLMARLKILGLLGAGIIATATTVIRLVILLGGDDESDITYTVLRFSVLGSAEASIGLICASLPALNALFTKVKMERTRASEQSRETDLPRSLARVASTSFGSSGKSKKGGILRVDESILQWTYVDMEDDQDGAHSRAAIAEIEMGAVTSGAAVQGANYTADDHLGRGISITQDTAAAEMWGDAGLGQEIGREKPLPLLPQIDRLSEFTIWQEILEVAELRKAAASMPVGVIEEEIEKIVDTRSPEVEDGVAVTEEGHGNREEPKDDDGEGEKEGESRQRIEVEDMSVTELEKPGRTWEDR